MMTLSSGSSAFVVLFPEYSFVVAVLANSRTGSGPLAELAGGLELQVHRPVEGEQRHGQEAGQERQEGQPGREDDLGIAVQVEVHDRR